MRPYKNMLEDKHVMEVSMTRQLEMEHEQKLARRLKKVGQTMEFGLAGSLAHAGSE